MAIGIGLGGLARGRDAAAEQAMNRARLTLAKDELGLKRQQLESTDKARQQKLAQDAVNSVLDTSKTLVTALNDQVEKGLISPEEAKQKFQTTMAPQMKRAAFVSQTLGGPDASFLTGQMSAIQAGIGALTPEQKRTQEAAGASRQVLQAFDPSGQNIGTAIYNPKSGSFETTEGGQFPQGTRFAQAQIESEGAAGLGLEPSKKAEGLIDETLINLDSEIIRLEQTMERFDPEFLTIAGKLKGGVSAIKEKLGRDLPDDEKQFLEDISTFKQNAIENVNRTIKEMTGAQMSEFEANRLRKQTPDPENDSPTEFVSKLKNALQKAKVARARFLYMKRNNIVHDFSSDQEPPLSLSGMENIIEKRGAAIEAEVKATQPNLSEREVLRIVGTRLREEFNL